MTRWTRSVKSLDYAMEWICIQFHFFKKIETPQVFQYFCELVFHCHGLFCCGNTILVTALSLSSRHENLSTRSNNVPYVPVIVSQVLAVF